MFDRWMRAFSALHAPANQRRNYETLNIFAATLAEVLVRCASTAQRICNEFAHFLAEKMGIGGAERTIFSARNTAPNCIGAAGVF